MSERDASAAYALTTEEGEGVWFLGTLMTVKATAEQTDGAFGLIEQQLPPGFAVPPHIHHNEDEAFYLLEGEAIFRCGDKTFPATAGTFVFLPRGVVHAFCIESSAPARLLQLTSPPGIERFFVEAGEPATTRTWPVSGPPAVERILALATQYRVEIGGAPEAATEA